MILIVQSYKGAAAPKLLQCEDPHPLLGGRRDASFWSRLGKAVQVTVYEN
jgi:hypothetical protein